MGRGKGSNRNSRIASYSSSSSTTAPYNTTSSSNSSSSSSTWWSNFCSSALRTKPQVSPSENSVRVVGDGLVRRLGLLDLVLIGVGASIGAGIFVVTGTVARDVGPGSSFFNCFPFCGMIFFFFFWGVLSIWIGFYGSLFLAYNSSLFFIISLQINFKAFTF